MKKSINAVAQSVTFTFEGGLEDVSLSLHNVSAANMAYATLHGLAARIGDNAAISKTAENGWKVTEAARRAAVLELVDHYASGSVDWNVRSAGRAKAPARNAAVLEIAAAAGMSYDEALTKIAEDALRDMQKMGAM